MTPLRRPLRPHRPAGPAPRPLLALAGLALTLPAAVQAQGYFSNWYVRHSIDLTVGYDSNIYGANTNEVDDAFSTLAYAITTGRTQNSLTQLDLSGQIQSTWFLEESNADSVDGAVQLDFAFPRDREDVSYVDGQVFWRRQTDLERTLQDRIRRDTYGFALEGEWRPTPKLVLSGGVDSRVTDRSAAGYAENSLTRFSAGIGHAWIPERRWLLEYSLELGEADPAQGASTDSLSHLVGVRIRGRILPKVTGTALVGYEHATFDGAQDLTTDGFSGSADVRWESSPLLVVRLAARRQMEFSPSGAVTRRTTGTLAVDRAFGPAFTLLANLSPDVIHYDRADNRKDDILSAGIGLRYRRTTRFFALLNVIWATVDSNLPAYDGDQTVVSLRAGLEF